MRILGVDPGSRLTGFGCIDCVGNQLSHVAHGTLRLANTSGRATIPLQERLLSIYRGLEEVIRELKPQIMAVEKVFFAKNAVSALKLGQARGAVVLTGMLHGVDIVEYSPTEVKLAVVGHGQAGKDQVARMLRIFLRLGNARFATADASDALALAVCHAFLRQDSEGLQTKPIRRRTKETSLAEALGHLVEKRVGRER